MNCWYRAAAAAGRRLPLALLLACLMSPNWASGKDPAAESKRTPDSEVIIGLCGARLAKVFDRLGPPEDVKVSGDHDGGVGLEYDTFSIKILNKTATACFFYAGWSGSVRGIRIGDTREQTVKALGGTYKVFKRPEGLEDYGWTLKAEDAVLWSNFDKEGKVRKMSVELNGG